MRALCTLLMVGLWCCAGSAARVDVEELAYPPSTAAGELACEARYYLWLPPDAPQIRGIIVHQHGCGEGAANGGITAAHDLHWQALARKHQCALLGSSYRNGENDCGIWSNPERGSRARFHQALADFAAKTKHPELKVAPWCLWGHSGGGWWCSLMLAKEPDRTVAAWLRSGTAFGDRPLSNGATKPPITDAARRVPIVVNPGIQEKNDTRFKSAYSDGLTMVRSWRAKGALIAFTPDPTTKHECGPSRYLAIPFFDLCLGVRLPREVGRPLLEMPTSDAWLAPLERDAAVPAARYENALADSSWLPSAAFAKAWSEYVRTGSVADATPPPPVRELSATAKGDAIELTWQADADLESGLAGFAIERDGQPLVQLPLKPKGKGNRAVYQGLSFHDTPDQPLVPLSFTDAGAKPGTRPRYRVRAINTAGLKSAPSAEVTP